MAVRGESNVPAPEARASTLPPAAAQTTVRPTEGYSFGEAAAVLGVDESKLRYWSQVGLVGPSLRVGTRQLFTFRDLVAARAAKELNARGFSPAEIRDALQAARKVLSGLEGETSTLIRLQVAFDGGALVIVEGDAAFEASGQRVFSFGLDELVARGAALERLTPPGARASSSAPTVARVNAGDVPYEGHGRNPVAPSSTRRLPGGGRRSAYDWFIEGLALDGLPGKDDEAAASYRQALALDPGLAAAYTNLGVIANRRGDVAGARAAFERALSLDPEQSEARFDLANLLLQSGQVELAAAELRRVLFADPGFADAHYNLATALELLGSRAQARAHLDEFLTLRRAPDDDPWVVEARRRRALLE